jgi:hypothetical protein
LNSIKTEHANDNPPSRFIIPAVRFSLEPDSIYRLTDPARKRMLPKVMHPNLTNLYFSCFTIAEIILLSWITIAKIFNYDAREAQKAAIMYSSPLLNQSYTIELQINKAFPSTATTHRT